MVTLRQIGRGVVYAGMHAVYVAAVGAVTTLGIRGYVDSVLPVDRPKHVYEASIERPDKTDFVVRLESGLTEVMLREEDGTVNLRDKRQKELDGLRQAYSKTRQRTEYNFNSLHQRLAEPEE